MNHLHQVHGQLVDQWRREGYPSPEYPTVSEVLEWTGDPATGGLRFLRKPQLRALETYWYLRLVEGTPHVFDLYQKLFPDPTERLEALGLATPQLAKLFFGKPPEALWERIRIDDAFVRQHRLESVRETLTLGYPSYILALAMGAGKTILIGAIFATEFAMALEYPDGPFVQNALIFAPGKTIIESLKELTSVPYEKILPPRLYKPFAASVKLTFTRDGDKDIPVVRGSAYNVVVTNTEKIRIQKETIRKSDLAGLFAPGREDDVRAEVANLRLQAIASLPRLGIFSNEAHHTYGQSLEAELKKVRRTVDYLAKNTDVVAVINTTGTPYFQRQPLRDVVIWYGLSQGIRDNILKDVSDNIHAFDFGGKADLYVRHVIEDFFKDYGRVRLPDGAPAKLALYFPQTDDLEALRPVIETALTRVGESPAVCLRNTVDSPKDEVDAFNRLSDPDAPHRVILLVNKGTEGWNCPSLFACALARRLKRSNNFVLQAATRCLRQVPGNGVKARIYLSKDNQSILENQLRETYGEDLADLNRATRETGGARLVLRKPEVPPVVLTRLVRTVTPGPAAGAVYDELARLYPGEDVPTTHVDGLAAQIASQTRRYEVREETVEWTLALVKAGGFRRVVGATGAEAYTVEINYPKEREGLVLHSGQMLRDNPAGFGFHYDPYNFDSSPERDFFERVLRQVNLYPAEVEDIYFIGGLADPSKTDFAVEYRGEDGRWHRYTPDFVIRKRVRPDAPPGSGRVLIVEVKSTQFEAATREDLVRMDRGEEPVTNEGRKAMALRRIERLNPDRLKYELVFVRGSSVTYDQLGPVSRFAREPERAYETDLAIACQLKDLVLKVDQARVRRIVLFGSRARGDARPDSDFDLLVVVRDLASSVDVEEADTNLQLEYYAVDTRRSVWGHLLDLAVIAGAEITVSPAGG